MKLTVIKHILCSHLFLCVRSKGYVSQINVVHLGLHSEVGTEPGALCVPGESRSRSPGT